MAKLAFDDFQLGTTLGVGTVGTIFAATNKHTGDLVALKQLHPGVSKDPLIRARFQREMAILDRLEHPNIIRFYGGGEHEGLLFYVMELVEGGSVRDLLMTNGPLHWPAVVSCIQQICSALQCAHNHGVIHRDLKPGNLFLTSAGQVKLGDFGIARDVTAADLTSEGLTVGTHAYMAPEQITGNAFISGQADIYALGCCAYEMLTGHKVFQGENFAQLFEQHLRAEPPRVRNLVPACPQALDDIVFQMLAKSPEQRPFNARQIQGVMLEIIETNQLREPLHHDPVQAQRGDISAAEAFDRGRELLADRVQSRLGASQGREVSWPVFALVGACIVIVILMAALLNQN
jgi:serine/threonine protein kinase